MNEISVEELKEMLEGFPKGSFVRISGGTASSASLDAFGENEEGYLLHLDTLIYDPGEWSDDDE